MSTSQLCAASFSALNLIPPFPSVEYQCEVQSKQEVDLASSQFVGLLTATR